MLWRAFQKGRDDLRKFTDDVVNELMRKFDPNHSECYVDAYLQQRNELLKKSQKDLMTFTGIQMSAFSVIPDERLKANAMNLFFEGTESTSTTITNLLLELTKHPDVQRKIQQELDSVVGRERLPSWLDKPNLPYLDATIQELFRVGALFLVTTMYSNFRCYVIFCLSLFDFETYVGSFDHFMYLSEEISLYLVCNDLDANMQQEETTIEGYKIPKRSVIVSNLYSIHFDPKLYPNPEKFEPKRFLSDQGKRIKMEGPFLFGLGKRACIGESLAQMEIFLLISSLLQSFTMPYAKDTQSFRFIPRE
ncbi:cytochrome P450 2U1 [Caerostris extrusa]|uniref:Cytochrome P450 2U1 n=1 Tax=Caerostris extrusa TaxID=172846 RepID=A0AAV4M7J9_CAEEX|nr:cytochrome P450 2U1 [Caerostris extrusa]